MNVDEQFGTIPGCTYSKRNASPGCRLKGSSFLRDRHITQMDFLSVGFSWKETPRPRQRGINHVKAFRQGAHKAHHNLNHHFD